MKFNFYKISIGNINELNVQISKYSNIIHQLLRENGREKLNLIKEKNSIENSIFEILSREDIIGVLTDQEYDLLDKEFKNKYLNKNILTKENIENMYIDINSISNQASNKLKEILKKALIDNNCICFWIV